MRLRIIAIGKKMPAWVSAGYQDYVRRLPAEWSIQLVELPLGMRGKGQPVQRAIDAEAEGILKAVGDDRVIALEVAGKPWSTAELAGQLNQWRASGDNYSLLIGGPDGLSPRCLTIAAAHWSLSPLTLPHALVRIVVVEQIYRAWSMHSGHPYHR
ncbi:MAG: 23S rRNA (pseudouridine(1915)-N(3))-methyltransferase RlmH [Porticoccaceae bacterium]